MPGKIQAKLKSQKSKSENQNNWHKCKIFNQTELAEIALPSKTSLCWFAEYFIFVQGWGYYI